MSEIYDILKNNTDLSEDILLKFETYAQMLLEWNNKINLTAITEPYDVAVKHFLDCLKICDIMKLPDNSKCIDIGTGAGFPGVVLMLANSTLNFTLLDSLNKRLKFLEELCKSLRLTPTLMHARAEDGAKDKNMRETFDFAFSRGVAKLNVLSEYCLPYVKLGGAFVAMKGLGAEEECELSKNALNTLGADLEEIKQFKLINGDARSIIIIRKTKHTPPMYPRIPSKISGKPL